MISINEFSVKREEHTHYSEQGILPIMKELAATLIGVPPDDRDVRVAASLSLSSRHSIRAITRFIKRADCYLKGVHHVQQRIPHPQAAIAFLSLQFLSKQCSAVGEVGGFHL